MIFFSKLKDRLVKYKSCRIYLGIALLQLVALLVLVSLVYNNVIEILKLSYSDVSPVAFKFSKMYYEALMCIIFEGWKVVLIIDAVLEVNTLLINSIMGLSIFSFVIYLSTVIEYVTLIEAAGKEAGVLSDQEFAKSDLNKNLMLSCTCISFVFTILNIWISRKVVKDFGWDTYKKLGASLSIRKMYKVTQLFSVILKLDVIFELTYITLVMYIISDEASPAFYVSIPVAIFLSLLLAREAIARESHILMILFYCAQASLIGAIIAIFTVQVYESGQYIYPAVVFFLDWYAFAIYTIIAVIFCITTLVLGILCEINFGRGLKPYVQWSFYGLRKTNKRTSQTSSQTTKWEIEGDPSSSKIEEMIDMERAYNHTIT